jgi:putative SOS response-associated peptidase YedK
MPVVLTKNDLDVWLDNKRSEAEIGLLLKPYVGNMNMYPVSTQVNNADINSTDCIAPISFEEVSEGKP